MNRKLYLYQDLLLSWQLMACLIIAMGIGRFIYTFNARSIAPYI